jgi:cold shock CspA family protein
MLDPHRKSTKEQTMTNTLKRVPAVTLAVIVLTCLLGALVATEAQAALRHFDGTVLSKNSDARTFRIESENGRNVKFRVNRSTEFERVPGGFSGLHRGLKVEVDAKRTDRGLLARQVEKHRCGGGGGGNGRH